MKKTLSFLIFVCVLFFSCQEDNEPIVQEVIIETEINYNVDFFENRNPVAYYGDTVRFSLKYSANTEITEIQLIVKVEDTTREKQIRVLDNVSQKDSLYFEIPITEIDFSQQFVNPNFTQFVVKFIKDENVLHSDFIQVLIKQLEEYNHQRLYNISSISEFRKNKAYSYEMGYILSAIDYTPSSNCTNCTKTSLNDSRLFLVNVPNSDFDLENDIAVTKDFIHGFFVPQENNSYAKINDKVNFLHIHKPQDILNLYNSSTNFETKFENIKVGDQFVFKYKFPNPFILSEPPYFFSDVYGIFEITHIEDDGLTSENGGTDDDYIEFRLKSFGKTYRFE